MDDFKIVFVGLKDGDHQYSFQIDSKFLDSYENSLIETCALDANLVIKKKPGMMECTFVHQGTIKSTCDRCGQPLDFIIEGKNEVIFKFSDEVGVSNDEIVYLVQTDFELDSAPYFYDFISLSLPSRKVHEEGKCDKKILDLLDDLNTKESLEYDPRWDALKQLKKEDK